MITLYNPKTEAFEANSGYPVSDPSLYLNILIELRVLNMILLGQQQGIVTQSLAELRSDAVNDSVNPFK